ncbi:MAG: hypothetical protein J7513_10935 [Solirubrobacteraceae bacterium]|nr:hypothetical protein [Solirubrobacteraceae bacterium]
MLTLGSAGTASAVEKPWTTAGIAGAKGWGTWWVENGRTYIQGTIRDTACDGYGAGLDVVFARRNSQGIFVAYRDEDVDNRQGCGTKTRDKTFNFNSEFKGSVMISIRESLLDAGPGLFDVYGDWTKVHTG